MRTAILSALVIVLCVLRCPAQESPQSQESSSKPAEPAAQPKAPATAPEAGEADPNKLAMPAAPGGSAKSVNAVPVDVKSYVLGAEDLIFITVWRSPEFSGQHMIRPDGKITINLVGEVPAAGLTPEQLGSNIREKLKKVLVDPDVSVAVTQVNSRRYFIEGEVLKPGEYKLVVPTHIFEALVNAGGFKDFAKQTDIRILRGSKVFHFNYKSAAKGKNADQNILLEPGDIIIVR